MKKIRITFCSLLVLCSCFMLVACGKKHTHNLTKVDEVKATCTSAGNTTYYTCDCGKYFSDAKGKTEIEKDSWVVPATGHDLTGEYAYTIEGTKAYKVKYCEHGDNEATELTNYIIATTDNIDEVVAEVVEGQTIVLSSGDYNGIDINYDSVTTAQNVTIVGVQDVTVDSIYINGTVNEGISIDKITFDGTVQYSGVIVGVDSAKDLTIRNCVFVGVFNAFQLLLLFPIEFIRNDLGFFNTLLIIIQLIYTVANALLLFKCYAMICPEGQEDMPRKPSKFTFINKIRAARDAKEEKAIEDMKNYYEEKLKAKNAKKKKKKK